MDPSLELIRALIEILKNDENLTEALGSGNKIFDRVPERQDGTPNVESPYISVGTNSFNSDDYDCIDSININLNFNVWSWGDGESFSSAEVRKLAFLVRKALNKKEVNLDQNGFVAIAHNLTTFNRASDGVTHQAVVGFRAEVDVLD